MKKITVVVISTILIIILFKLLYTPIWDINAKKLGKDILSLSNNDTIALNELTDFNWDTVYSFSGYTSKEYIYEVIEFKSIDIKITLNDSTNQLIFMYDKQIVCYLHGSADKLGYLFDFTEYIAGSDKAHVQLNYDDSYEFSIGFIDNIIYLKYK